LATVARGSGPRHRDKPCCRREQLQVSAAWLGQTVRRSHPGAFELLVFYDDVRLLNSDGNPVGFCAGFDDDRTGEAQRCQKPADCADEARSQDGQPPK